MRNRILQIVDASHILQHLVICSFFFKLVRLSPSRDGSLYSYNILKKSFTLIIFHKRGKRHAFISLNKSKISEFRQVRSNLSP